MFYQFTGQPGHGKTVLALEFALDMKAKADKAHDADPAKHPYRELYVCNVRDFNAAKAGAVDLPPEQLLEWHTNPQFDHAIILIDEAYEHGMFPKRAPGMKVPEHVQLVAKHRHRGIDFIMICQSPTRQMDDFLHDLIEEHYHVRRRYGLPLVVLKRFDRFERNAVKAVPLTVSRRRYPKHVFDLYTSTKYDTTEKRIPWFYWAILAVLIGVLLMVLVVRDRVANRLGGKPESEQLQAGQPVGNGAPATVPAALASHAHPNQTLADYEAAQQPRNALKPWSAPIYDGAQAKAQPELFCMSSGQGQGADGQLALPSCNCVTEQGTPYRLPMDQCHYVARWGAPYNPYTDRSARKTSPPPESQDQPPPPPGEPYALAGAVIGGDPSAVVGAGTRAPNGI